MPRVLTLNPLCGRGMSSHCLHQLSVGSAHIDEFLCLRSVRTSKLVVRLSDPRCVLRRSSQLNGEGVV